MIRLWLAGMVMIWCGLAVQAQSSLQNPFDIQGRKPVSTVDSLQPPAPEESKEKVAVEIPRDSIPVMEKTDSLAAQEIMSLTKDPAHFRSIYHIPFVAENLPNPWLTNETLAESNQTVADVSDNQTEKAETEDTSTARLLEIESLTSGMTEVHVSKQNIRIIMTILSLLLLAVLLTINRSMINKCYRAIANDNYLRFLFREYNSMPWMYWMFYFLFLLNLGFFIYLLAGYFRVDLNNSLPNLLLCVGVVVLVYVAKHLVLNLLGNTFPVEKETDLYSFVTMLVNSQLGLILVAVNLLVSFAPPQVVSVAIWLGIGSIILMYLFRMLKGLFISSRFITGNQFHFFLYLCSAEIAPLLILGKMALVNFG